MSNPAKQKGTSFETLIRQYLNDHGFENARRVALQGGGDTGDINGIQSASTNKQVAIQCKNQKKFDLSSWLNATVEQAARLDDALPVLVVKRPGKGVAAAGDNYVIMRLEDLIYLLKEANFS
jgi:Holliday junction resolvase